MFHRIISCVMKGLSQNEKALSPSMFRCTGVIEIWAQRIVTTVVEQQSGADAEGTDGAVGAGSSKSWSRRCRGRVAVGCQGVRGDMLWRCAESSPVLASPAAAGVCSLGLGGSSGVPSVPP